MTAQEKLQYKTEVKAALEEYLVKNNIKDADPVIIMQHLPNMYRHLEDKSLIKYGLNWQLFNRFAQEQFVYMQMMGEFGI